mmetsp:Transcript_3543/g.12073  ORF Transcript_3543/g.12073 Transcript_3543/m.12073 type:complete len:209 (+) Transcript_3543:114-740(+)
MLSLVRPSLVRGSSVIALGRVVEVKLRRADRVHDDVEDAKLPRGERADHDAPRREPLRAELHESRLRRDVGETREHPAAAARASFVDLRQERVRGVGDDRRGDARDDAGRERHGDVLAAAHLLRGLSERIVNFLRRRALHGELGHGVRHLLREDGPEPGVERADHALFLDHLRHAPEHAVRVRGVRHEPDARRLERAEEDVRDELRGG